MLKTRYLKKKIESYDSRMADLFADCHERSVRSFDGTRIAYRVTGEGLPLVISPGVFTSYMFFHYMKDYFSPRHKVILWDYRGHPDSEVPDDIGSFTIENCARDLKAVLDDAGVEKAIHIGFSMGVMTILEFYRQFPESVLGLIPINGPYAEGFGGFSESKEVQSVIVNSLDYLSKHTWLVEWFKPVIVLPINMPIAKRVELNPTLAPEEEMDLYFIFTTKMDWRLGLHALAAMGRYDGSEILDSIDVPTLLICGSKDNWTPKRIADEMHRRIRGSEYTVIPGGSHATPAENPQMINFRIDLFLRTYFHDVMGEHGEPERQRSRVKGTAGVKKKEARKKSRGRPAAGKASTSRGLANPPPGKPGGTRGGRGASNALR